MVGTAVREPPAGALAHLQPPLLAEVAALVAGLTAKDPRSRPPSSGQVADRAGQLRAALTATAAQLRPE